MLLRRRQLDLLRRPAAHHRQSRTSPPIARCSRSWASRPAERREPPCPPPRSPELERVARAAPCRRARAARGARSNRRRVRACVVDGRRLLAFASNDYLGLASDPAIAAAARDGVASLGRRRRRIASRLRPHGAHAALEDELAAFVAPCDGARALTFSTGLSREPRDPHRARRPRRRGVRATASTTRASTTARCCRARSSSAIAHRDVARSQRSLAASTARAQAHRHRRRVQHGRRPGAAARACSRSRSGTTRWLVVDDAHGFGVLGDGRGTLAHFGLRSDRIVYMGTLGKAAGVAGAFVAAHPAVIETLVQTARPYIYTTAAPPAARAARCRAALAIVRDDAPRRAATDAIDRALPCGAREDCRGRCCRRRRRSSRSSSARTTPRSRSRMRCSRAAFWCRRSGRPRCRRERRGCAFRCRPRTRTPTWRRCWRRCVPHADASATPHAARRVGGQRPAARAAARLGDARRAVRADRAGARAAVIACTSSICRATATRRRRHRTAALARRDRRRTRSARSATSGAARRARLVARRRGRDALGSIAPRSRSRVSCSSRRRRVRRSATTGRTRCATKRCDASATSCASPTA